jgi:phospholipase C
MTDREHGTPPDDTRISRRTLLKGAAGVGAAAVGSGILVARPAFAGLLRSSGATSTPLEHIVISCQENRSFDHYFGYAPWVGKYGPPKSYSLPDGNGGRVRPYRFTELSTPDVPHSWTAIHEQWNGGKMDGFYTNAGIWALGYYTAQDLPFYYGLFESSTLCVNFFCSVLGPTWPNRFYLAAGTSGGITTNGVWGYGVFD